MLRTLLITDAKSVLLKSYDYLLSPDGEDLDKLGLRAAMFYSEDLQIVKLKPTYTCVSSTSLRLLQTSTSGHCSSVQDYSLTIQLSEDVLSR
eukprot:4226727-Amphidinium_carterae.1